MTRRLGLLDRVTVALLMPIVAFLMFAVSNPDSYMASVRGVALYVGAPTAMASAILAAFLLDRAARTKLFLSGWSVIAAVYLFELYLTLIPTVAKPTPAGWDTRTRVEVIAHLREKGIRAYPSVTAKNFRDAELQLYENGADVLPLGGVPLATIVHCNESGYWTTYDSDRYGFSNPDEVWDGVVDLALVGDSYTQGACVRPGHTVAGHLRDTGITVVNVGAQGNGPLAELGSIREYVAAKRPRSVFWFFYYNDLLNDLPRERSDPILVKYVDSVFSQHLMDRASILRPELESQVDAAFEDAVVARARATMVSSGGSPERDLALLRRHNPLNAVPWLTLRRTRVSLGLFEAGNDWLPPDSGFFAQVLTKARAVVESWGGELAFVVLPSFIAATSDDPEHLRRYAEAGIEAARAAGLPVLDLTSAFRKHSDPPSLFAGRASGNHYSPAGYALAASLVAERLLSGTKDAE